MKSRLMGAFAALMTMAGGNALAVPAIEFIIDGDTFTEPFSFSNISTEGELLTSIMIDLNGTGVVFDPEDFGPPGNDTFGTPFTPLNGTDASTGLLGNTVVDGGSTLDIIFNDFDAGETFTFLLDVDPADPLAFPSIFGDMLAGAVARVDFSNGQSIIGVFELIMGNPDASGFVARAIIPTPDPVPVPPAIAMMALGMAGVARIRRRKSA